jgi:hypothetical protein
MRCYKYISDVSSLASITAGEMRFTVPAELNDPSELFPKFSREEVVASLCDLRNRGHTAEEVAGLKRQHALMRALVPSYWRADLPLTATDADSLIRLPIYDNVILIEQLFVGMLSAMSGAVAVACLSKRWDSLPMWAHYAHRARGAVIAYDNLEAVFPGDDTGCLNCLKEVSYSRESAGISFYPDSYGAIFFSKLRDWAYEEEVRIASELTRCTKVSLSGAVSYSRTVPVSHVAEVIIGWRMPKASVEKVLMLLDNDACRHVRIRNVRVHRGQLSLQSL